VTPFPGDRVVGLIDLLVVVSQPLWALSAPTRECRRRRLSDGEASRQLRADRQRLDRVDDLLALGSIFRLIDEPRLLQRFELGQTLLRTFMSDRDAAQIR
jgi:hypothetical protein